MPSLNHAAVPIPAPDVGLQPQTLTLASIRMVQRRRPYRRVRAFVPALCCARQPLHPPCPVPALVYCASASRPPVLVGPSAPLSPSSADCLPCSCYLLAQHDTPTRQPPVPPSYPSVPTCTGMCPLPPCALYPVPAPTHCVTAPYPLAQMPHLHRHAAAVAGIELHRHAPNLQIANGKAGIQHLTCSAQHVDSTRYPYAYCAAPPHLPLHAISQALHLVPKPVRALLWYQ